MKDDLKKVQKALIKLYLTVKIRKKEDVRIINNAKAENITEEILREEEAKLKHQNLMTLVEYIKSSIDVLVTIKVEEQLAIERGDVEEDNEYAAEKYETLLKKEESDIRQHISIEHQLKIHAERLANHIEELEKENDSLIKQLEKYEKIKKNEEQYSVEINNIKQVLKSYEDQNLKLSQNEKRLKAKLFQKEKELKHLEKKVMGQTASCLMQNNHNGNHINNNTISINGNANANANGNSNSNVNATNSSNNFNGNISNSICYHSRSKSKMSDDEKKEKHHSFVKKSPIPIERVKVQDKINEYHKLIDQRAHLSKNKTMRTSREKSSCSNMSYLSKERSIDNDLSTITKRNEELTQRLHDLTLKVIKNEERKNKTPAKCVPSNKKNVVYEKKKENKIIATKLLKKSPSEIPINQSDIIGPESFNMSTNQNNHNNTSSHLNNNFLNQNGNKPMNQLNYKQLLYSKAGNTSNSSISLRKNN